MSKPRDLSTMIADDASDEEHQAWIAACDKLNELLRYAFSADTLVTVNGEVSNETVDALRYWGETLVQLRQTGDLAQAGRAYREAKQIATEGRRPRRA